MRLLLAAAFACLTAASAWACPAGARHETHASAPAIDPAATASSIFAAERHAGRAAVRIGLRTISARIAPTPAPPIDVAAAADQARAVGATLRVAARLAAAGAARRLAPIAAAAEDSGPLSRLVRTARAEARAALSPYRYGIARARTWTSAIESAVLRLDPKPLLAGASSLARFAADSTPSLTLPIDAPPPAARAQAWTEAAADAPPPLARVTARVRDVMRGLAFGVR